jgi:serine/threonine protein kinase
MKTNLIGEKLLNYEIKSLASADDTFSIYLAEHTLFQRKVYIKTLNTNHIGNVQAKEQLKNEALAIRFTHHQTRLLYDLIETNDNIYLITEKIDEAIHLEQYIAQFGTMTEEKAIRIFSQILEIVGAAHKIGLIHRNLQAKQIVLQVNQVKVLGFEETQTLSPEAAYQSPEELKKNILNEQSNIYSLGKILTLMLLGKTEVHKTDWLSPKLKEAIAVATENNPKERFADCQEFASALSEEVSTEEVADKHAFKQLPTIIFGVLLSIFALFVYNIAEEDNQKNQLAYDLYNQTKIQKTLDSVKRAKQQEFIRDSIRIARNKAENMQKVHIHKVEKGETLKEIAERYNMSLSHLKQLNGFNEKNTLKANVGLRVVVREYHKVLDKEELWQIAQKYGITKFDIMKTNDIDPVDERKEVYPGRELIIPIKK